MLGFMHQFGTSTWDELRNQWTGTGKHRRRRYHAQEFAEVSREAQERIAQLGHDETFERLHRYRVSGLGRVWGFELDGVFYLLWWDTGHSVYPVD